MCDYKRLQGKGRNSGGRKVKREVQGSEMCGQEPLSDDCP